MEADPGAGAPRQQRRHKAPVVRQRAELDGDVCAEEEREEAREGWSRPRRLPVTLSTG
jgi:hypothetical protein